MEAVSRDRIRSRDVSGDEVHYCNSLYEVERLTKVPMWIVELMLSGKTACKSVMGWEFERAVSATHPERAA